MQPALTELPSRPSSALSPEVSPALIPCLMLPVPNPAGIELASVSIFIKVSLERSFSCSKFYQISLKICTYQKELPPWVPEITVRNPAWACSWTCRSDWVDPHPLTLKERWGADSGCDSLPLLPETGVCCGRGQAVSTASKTKPFTEPRSCLSKVLTALRPCVSRCPWMGHIPSLPTKDVRGERFVLFVCSWHVSPNVSVSWTFTAKAGVPLSDVIAFYSTLHLTVVESLPTLSAGCISSLQYISFSSCFGGVERGNFMTLRSRKGDTVGSCLEKLSLLSIFPSLSITINLHCIEMPRWPAQCLVHSRSGSMCFFIQVLSCLWNGLWKSVSNSCLPAAAYRKIARVSLSYAIMRFAFSWFLGTDFWLPRSSISVIFSARLLMTQHPSTNIIFKITF